MGLKVQFQIQMLLFDRYLVSKPQNLKCRSDFANLKDLQNLVHSFAPAPLFFARRRRNTKKVKFEQTLLCRIASLRASSLQVFFPAKQENYQRKFKSKVSHDV